MELLTILCATFLVCGTVAACFQIWDLWTNRRNTIKVKPLCDNCGQELKQGNVFRLHSRNLCRACVQKWLEKVASREKAND